LFAARDEGRGLFADLDVGHDLAELELVDDRPEGSIRVEGVGAQRGFCCGKGGFEGFGELLGDGFLDEDAACCCLYRVSTPYMWLSLS
jgi:hypothetical protein